MTDVLHPSLDQAAIRAAIQASFESRLPKAIHDATGELVEAMVKAEITKAVRPMLMRGMRPQGVGFDGDDLERVVGFTDLEKGDGDKPVKGRQIGQVPSGKLDQQVQDPKGLLFDPFTALDQMGFRERPSSITYRTLAEMARRVPPYAAILQTRINQIAAFAEPQPDEHSVGFKVTLRDRRVEMDDELTRRADELTRWIVKCGNPEVKKKRPSLDKYLRMTVWDSLVYDQDTTEVVHDRRGIPAYWRPLDASTIRISDDLDDVDDDEDAIRYVQLYDDTIIAEFRENELLFGVRNPRTDIRYAGYGQSELELLVVIVTAILWGINYNANFFKQGTVAKGILNFKGAIPDRELIAFRRQWYAMISGVENAWRTPIVNSEDLQYINMQTSNRDMEFSSWLDWLLKVTCAVCQIAPEEIGFQFGNTGQSSSMSEGSQEQKLKFSKDKGLVPLAKHKVSQLNKILERVDPRFQVQFAGINARSAEELIDLQTKEVSSVKTVDEARKERGLKPMPNGKGDVILNQTWLAFAQAKDMAGGGGAGAPGVPDGAAIDGNGLQGDPQQQQQQGPTPQQKAGFMQAQQQQQQQDPMQKSRIQRAQRKILDLEVDV